ncbi:MAG: nitroreductase [Rhizobacter sp.]|nr:nitroreductase [Rhizobacter sp.]
MSTTTSTTGTVSTPPADLWETMRTARATRSFRAEPVDLDVLARCLEAATWAPSGGNQQPWRFVVLQSPEARRAVAVGAERALATIARTYGLSRPAPDDQSQRARMARVLFDLHEGAATVPAPVLFCTRGTPGTPPLLVGASIYPAMQNFLLAARASGLGALVTGWHETAPSELREAVRVPDDWQLAALLAVGWPARGFGPVRRRPLADVSALDTWDTPLVTADQA